jgi:hypothetical protein
MVERKLILIPSVIIDALFEFKVKVISIDDDRNKSELAIIFLI